MFLISFAEKMKCVVRPKKELLMTLTILYKYSVFHWFILFCEFHTKVEVVAEPKKELLITLTILFKFSVFHRFILFCTKTEVIL